jgi:phage-related tail fiber protein
MGYIAATSAQAPVSSRGSNMATPSGNGYRERPRQFESVGDGMEKHDKAAPVDPETILFTLDQLGQTVEVMNKVNSTSAARTCSRARSDQTDCTESIEAAHEPRAAGSKQIPPRRCN